MKLTGPSGNIRNIRRMASRSAIRPTMRLPVLLVLTMAGCGQIAATQSDKRGSSSPPDVPPDVVPAASAAPAPAPVPSLAPPAAGTCGVTASLRSFATTDEQAVALHGLWVTCASDPAPGLCPPLDASMFFGALDTQSDVASRATACGHLTSHGDGFIPNAAYTFTYDVKDIAPSGSLPTYVLHVWNATADRTFVLTYRDDAPMTGYRTEAAITLGEPDARVGTLRHSAFTTF